MLGSRGVRFREIAAVSLDLYLILVDLYSVYLFLYDGWVRSVNLAGSLITGLGFPLMCGRRISFDVWSLDVLRCTVVGFPLMCDCRVSSDVWSSDFPRNCIPVLELCVNGAIHI